MPTAAVLAVTTVAGAVSSRNASKKAASAQKSAAKTAAEQTTQSASQARQDLFDIFPQAQQTAQQGFQGALDVFGQSLPAQTSAFQQGNVGAQQAILQGLPQIQNALFGGNVDFGQLQPFQVQQPDLGFFQQTLPQVQQRQELEAQQTQQAALNNGLGPFDVNNPAFTGRVGPFQDTRALLGGGFTGSGGFNRSLGGFDLSSFNRK